MKNLTKENKGITMVVLVITIILLIILATTITISAIDAYKDAQVTEFVLKMQTVQAKIEEKNIKDDEIALLPSASGGNLTILQNAKANGEISTTENFKYISKSNVVDLLELDDIDDEFLINFTTREVVSVTGVEYENKTYYTQYLLPGAQTLKENLTEITRNCNFSCNVFIKDKKAEIEVYDVKIENGELSYQEEGDSYWTTISSATNINDIYKFTIDKSGTYNIKIKDNASSKEYSMEDINIALINFPELETGMTLVENENTDEEDLFIDYDYYYDMENETWDSTKWIYAKKDSEYYVWLPRYAYRINSEKLEIEYIKDSSNVSTSSKLINLNEDIRYEIADDGWLVLGIKTSPWKVPLKYDNIEGTWVKTSDLNAENLDLKELTSREGRIISWNADQDAIVEQWVVLYDDVINGLQIISKEDRTYNGGAFSFGREDSYLNKNSKWPSEVDTALKRRIYSYNNIVTTLNSACEELVVDKTNVKDVRSVGSNPLNKNDESNKYVEEVTSVLIKDMDENAKYDVLQMFYLDILDKTNSKYFLASRSISLIAEENINELEILEVNVKGDEGDEYDDVEWWNFEHRRHLTINASDLSVIVNDDTANIRPVVILDSSVQFTSGEGTETSPYTFYETKIDSNTSYVGYYADIDGNGTVDGIIYADLAVSVSGQWGDNWGNYSYSAVSGLKEYTISQEEYEGDFGKNSVIKIANNSTGTDRFYVMALENFTKDGKSTFYWYYNAYGKIDNEVSTDANDFGEGKENTIKMINDWNNNTDIYGIQTTAESGQTYIDLWGAIQDGQYSIVSTEEDTQKWFVPSKAEWSAFGGNLNITSSNYETLGLSDRYWSSSQYNSTHALDAGLRFGCMGNNDVNGYRYVRLSATF